MVEAGALHMLLFVECSWFMFVKVCDGENQFP